MVSMEEVIEVNEMSLGTVQQSLNSLGTVRTVVEHFSINRQTVVKQ